MQHDNKEMFFRPLIKINVIVKNNYIFFSQIISSIVHYIILNILLILLFARH